MRHPGHSGTKNVVPGEPCARGAKRSALCSWILSENPEWWYKESGVDYAAPCRSLKFAALFKLKVNEPETTASPRPASQA